MARFVSVLGFLDGKLQNTVTATVKGQSTIRAYQPNVSNPSTEKQVSNRDTMTWVTSVAMAINFLLLVPYLKPKSRTQSPINSFNKQLGKLISLIASDLAVIRSEVITSHLTALSASNLLIANGPKSLVATGTPTLVPTSGVIPNAPLTFSWNGNILSRADQLTDTIMFASVNMTTKSAYLNPTTVARSANGFSAQIGLPSRTATDLILIFAFFKGANDNTTSKGMVFGHLVGTTFTPTTVRTYVA